MAFQIIARDRSGARAGLLETARGPVETPVFMPVATQASVKALDADDVRRLKPPAMLANSYHLYLRPGVETVKLAGGLHRFMDYEGFILTDSGGFQVLSLADLREVDDEGVTFRSHLDGSTHRLTPQSVIKVQAELGANGWTTLDECPPYPCDESAARQALERTMRWINSSVPAVEAARKNGNKDALFFPILQGGFFPALRRRAAEHMNNSLADGVSIGGFSVGEPKELTWSTLAETCSLLREDRPRYLMGVGTPRDLWDAVARGADMMDCVYPTRVARNGQIMARAGKFNVSNGAFRKDFSPLDRDCSCFVCQRYSRAYLNHLFRAKELAVYRLLSYHNLHFMAETAALIRKSIIAGRFTAAYEEFAARYGPGP